MYVIHQTAYWREIKDNGYKFVFTNYWLVDQRNSSWKSMSWKNMSWIRQRSTKRVNSFVACSAFCLGPPNHDPVDSEKWLRVYKSSATMARHAWLVDKAPAKTHKNWNARLDAFRSPFQKSADHEDIVPLKCTYTVTLTLFKSGYHEHTGYNFTARGLRCAQSEYHSIRHILDCCHGWLWTPPLALSFIVYGHTAISFYLANL